MLPKEDPYYYPLPLTTLENFVRFLFTPIGRGESCVLTFASRAGRRALCKFLISEQQLFNKIIPRGSLNYRLYFIDPPELVEQTSTGYLSLIYKEITGDSPSSQLTRLQIFMAIKDKLQQIIQTHEVVLFLNEFDELPFLDTVLADNLKVLWSIDKTRVHYVFLPFSPISPHDLERFGKLREVMMENSVVIPPLTDPDMEYIISRYAHTLNYAFSESARSAIKKISGGNPYIIKVACRIISQENPKTDPSKFLENHYQIQILKQEENGSPKTLTLSESDGVISYNGKPLDIHLTGKEYDLLCFFLENKNCIHNRDRIAEVLWGKNSFEKYSDWAIDQAIHVLRTKLNTLGVHTNLETVKGKGYRYKEF